MASPGSSARNAAPCLFAAAGLILPVLVAVGACTGGAGISTTRDAAPRDEAGGDDQPEREPAADRTPADLAVPGHDRPPVDVAPADATMDGPPPACGQPPCAERPILFVHGFTGGNDDWQTMLDALIADDPRYDGYRLAGNQDHLGWEARSIDRRRWLFALDYYLANASDSPHSYTAGPGRIGSNRQHGCTMPTGAGFVIGDRAEYDAAVEHEYAADLAGFVDGVLRATGADKIDVVAHSMGGIILRSYLQFHGGKDRVERVLFLASPVRGVSLIAFLEYFGIGRPSWMADHEVVELDGGSLLSSTHFVRCGEDPARPGAFAAKVLEDELALPPGVAYHVMSGDRDLFVSYDAADHPLELTHEVVPGADHSGMLRAPEAIARVRELLGGQVP